MIAAVIRWSVANRLLVLLAAAMLAAWGRVAGSRTPLDAIPDLSDVQVIIRTTFPGQAPQIVEDQVTYPLTTTMLSVPRRQDGARLFVLRRIVRLRAVRGRHRSVLGALAGARVPEPGAGAAAGRREGRARPRRDRRRLDLPVRARRSQRRARPRRTARAAGLVPQVRAEDGAERGRGRDRRRHGQRQYQVVVDPDRLRAYGIPLEQVVEAMRTANGETGGSVVEIGEAEYMVRARGYLQSLDDFRAHRRRGRATTARRCGSATSRTSSSARKCAAASPSWTAKAKWSAA